MKIQIIAVGTKMPAWVQQGYQEYAKRMPRSMSVQLREIPLGYRSKSTSSTQARSQEGDAILSLVNTQDWVIALNVEGQSWSTQELTQTYQQWCERGQSICMLIGGPDGLSPACLKRANVSWSLSSLTLPHPLVRVMLMEQLYRVSTLMADHPYHK